MQHVYVTIWSTLPGFHLFSMHMIDSTCIWSIQPIYDIVDNSTHIWYCGLYLISLTWILSMSHILDLFNLCFIYLHVFHWLHLSLIHSNSIWYWNPISSTCIWLICLVYDIFNHFILHFGQLNMCMAKTKCIWFILTVFDLFDLYMTNPPGI